MSKVRWATAEADEFIRLHYHRDLSATEIGKHLGVGKNSVIGRAFRLGLAEKMGDGRFKAGQWHRFRYSNGYKNRRPARTQEPSP